jgi:hypothetical protein
MSYRCGVSAGAARVIGVEPGPPRIKCDTCGATREITGPPRWFLANKPVPGWTKSGEGAERTDTCGRCLAEVNNA